jgi:geranylgeranyl diphosphate synthase type 3
VKEIVTDLHNASLLIDDIEDNSKLRRGSPVAHDVYGIPITLNCANYVYFLAQKKCLRMGNFEAIEAFTEEIINLHRGQGIELFWREHLRCPTEEAYFNMVSDKTGGLFRLAYKLMLPFSTTVKKEDIEKHLKFLDLFGIYFQIRDDLMNILNWENVNIIGEKNEMMHTYCEDITEGKFSFPVIFAIKYDLNNTELLNILRQRTENNMLKKRAVEYMHQVGALSYTRKILLQYRTSIYDMATQLSDCEMLLDIIERLEESHIFTEEKDS